MLTPAGFDVGDVAKAASEEAQAAAEAAEIAAAKQRDEHAKLHRLLHPELHYFRSKSLKADGQYSARSARSTDGVRHTPISWGSYAYQPRPAMIRAEMNTARSTHQQRNAIVRARERLLKDTKEEKQEDGWDPSTFRLTPPAYKGIKPSASCVLSTAPPGMPPKPRHCTALTSRRAALSLALTSRHATHSRLLSRLLTGRALPHSDS